MSAANAILATLILALAGSSRLGAAAEAVQGDAARGQDIFNDRCSMCHLEEGQGQGPDLKGVVGRPAASLRGFAYTAALKTSGLVWTPPVLDRFLAAPGSLAPGTAMPLATPDPRERADLIAFLASRK